MVSFTDLPGYAIAFVVIAVTLGIGATILTSVQGTQTADTTAYNISGYGLESLGTLGSWLNTQALIIAAAVVLAVIVTFFAFRGRMG